MVVVCDDPREGSGGCELTVPAELADPDALNFMATHGRGPISLALTAERCQALNLRPIAPHGNGRLGRAAMISIEAREGVSTGISTADRARTIEVAVDPASSARDLTQPGHVFPVCAKSGGVLERADKAEASVDLARLAGRSPAAVNCGVLDGGGSAIGSQEAVEYCLDHGLKRVSVDDVVAFRLCHDRLATRVASVAIDTEFGQFRAIFHRTGLDDDCHVALVKGDVEGQDGIPICMPSAGDRNSLRLGLQAIEDEGRGVVVCVLDRRGAQELERAGAAVPGRERHETLPVPRPLGRLDCAIGAQIVADLSISRARVYTDEPMSIAPLLAYLLMVDDEVSVRVTQALRD